MTLDERVYVHPTTAALSRDRGWRMPFMLPPPLWGRPTALGAVGRGVSFDLTILQPPFPTLPHKGGGSRGELRFARVIPRVRRAPMKAKRAPQS